MAYKHFNKFHKKQNETHNSFVILVETTKQDTFALFLIIKSIYFIFSQLKLNALLFWDLYREVLLWCILVIEWRWIRLRLQWQSPLYIVLIISITFYSLLRYLSEIFREPDVQMGYLYLGTTMGQVLSLIMLFFGLMLILILIDKKNEL